MHKQLQQNFKFIFQQRTVSIFLKFIFVLEEKRFKHYNFVLLSVVHRNHWTNFVQIYA